MSAAYSFLHVPRLLISSDAKRLKLVSDLFAPHVDDAGFCWALPVFCMGATACASGQSYMALWVVMHLEQLQEGAREHSMPFSPQSPLPGVFVACCAFEQCIFARFTMLSVNGFLAKSGGHLLTALLAHLTLDQ